MKKIAGLSTSLFLATQITLLTLSLPSCQNNAASSESKVTDSLTEEQKHLPEHALKSLTVAEGLAVTPFATEPMLRNPTNIDVDERGRVWVTEAYNYRPQINGNPTTAVGDRIVILEDRNGDGRADTSKVFYQGPELNAPLGVCVLGNRVIVSQSPYIWNFYDDNGDDKADRKEIMFQGIGGEQHDHGAHSMAFAVDGKLYFTLGNEGKTLKDKNGKPVLDQDGDEIGPKKYRQGLVFRCNPDGSQVECLGENFRNNYEVAVDSYGTVWQSDNDDDGNRGTRINYVMPYGNYGYTDEMTGAGWKAMRTNMEDSIPLQHWHLNDPGTIPNLLQTGAGSPTGMIIYEGSLLPAAFQNGMIHCDAGPNVVRSYPVKKSGAGYTAEITNLLKGERDQWFRPADICVAPDGSLIVADWYDPGVGGHAAGDQLRGRIYRVAPPKSEYRLPQIDYNTPAGAVQALQNPNLAVRYHAWTALQAQGNAAIPELQKLWQSGANPRMRARAFWFLAKTTGDTTYIQQALKDNNPDLRIAGLRAAAQTGQGLSAAIAQLVADPDPQVRRECAIALHHNKSPEAAQLWTRLATQYSGNDRWALEALGIGADDQWDSFFTAFIDAVKDPLAKPAYQDIVWRARTEKAVPYLAKLAANNSTILKERLRYFRAFDFNTGSSKRRYLIDMIAANSSGDTALNKVILRHLDVEGLKGSPVAQKALTNLVQMLRGTPEYLELVERYEIKGENPQLLQLAIAQQVEPVGRNAGRLLLKHGGNALAWQVVNGKDTAQAGALLRSLSGVGNKESLDMLQAVVLQERYDTSLRRRTALLLGKSWGGEERVLQLLKDKKVPAPYIPAVVTSVSGAWRGSVRTEAESYLPNSTAKASKKMPTIAELAALKPVVENGRTVFSRVCATCHVVGSTGYEFGPALTEIGTKLPKEEILKSILHPSAGIAFNYEGWELKMKDGSTLSGIVSSKTESDLDLRFPGGNKMSLKRSDIQNMKMLKQSLMPESLHQNLSAQEMADLLEFLRNQRRKA
jgi:putative membrane-bound dehydrogenase-like protein